MRGWKSQTRMVSNHGNMDAMLSCILNLCDAHSYDLFCAQGLLQGSSFKKKSVSGGSFIRGKVGKRGKERVNPFKPEFTIVILIHYKPRVAVAILDL